MNARLLSAAIVVCAFALAIPAHAQGTKFLGGIWKSAYNSSLPSTFNGLFTQVTPENAGKWGVAEPTRGAFQWQTLDAMATWGDGSGRLVKQHTFVWGQQEPSWIGAYTNADTVKAIVSDWMRQYFQRYGARTDMVDVVNEPLHAPASFRAHLGGAGSTGWDWVIWSFQTARTLANQYAPDCKLILNDYEIIYSDSRTTEYLTIINLLKDRNLIDGIGEQAHFYESTDTAVLHRNLNRLAATGLPIYISEFDMDFTDDTQQLNAYKRTFKLFWDHPAVAGVTLWGYMQNAIWRTNAYLIRSDGTERPALTWLRGYTAATAAQPDIITPAVVPGSAAPRSPTTPRVDLSGRAMPGSGQASGVSAEPVKTRACFR